MPGILHFNGFEMNTPSHMNHGMWVHPDNNRHRYTDIDYWTGTARLLERGLFDALFLADVVGTYDVYGSSRDAALERGVQSPNNDPFLLVPAMAAVTRDLGFAVTFTTTYEPPFGNARRFSTLDHLTRGRVAWNVVTGYLPDAARNYGLDAAVGYDDRYERAEEFLEVSYKLWEGSWDDDAVVRDRARRRYSDPAKVHEVGHRGAHFTVDGPHLSEPSPQRTPVIYQAGSSDRGRDFAARHAEAMFVGARTEDEAHSVVASTRELAVAHGRTPDDIRFLTGLNVIVAETDAAARAKLEDFLRYRDTVGYLVHFGGGTGVDLAAHGAEQLLGFRARGHIESNERSFADKRAREVVDFYDDPTADPFLVVGSPTRVADRIEELADSIGLDGFNLIQYLSPGTFADFVELVVPELQRRGRYRTSYEEGETLRERLLGAGPRLSPHHPGAGFRRDAVTGR
ncbi:NtaA/DmoA family FMN-dependent monooxygenase [Pseudonocardia sp. EC080610-09]|uniref:NtaA/DmoA family FMN-dependent monooxygenase n=1 Tax=Pseudonocardia sp. EC080610-09 TaxID=1688404 RepID=UPI000761AF63|nr:NtaA/DmoA family FMN-dependent monooxygenase [Pseudonocardia sp. EC080610-09]